MCTSAKPTYTDLPKAGENGLQTQTVTGLQVLAGVAGLEVAFYEILAFF
jgi:hypothetical protein